MHTVDREYIRNAIRTIPDWPQKGVMFRDITTIFQDAKALRGFLDAMIQRYMGQDLKFVAGLDARGFLIGVTIAYGLNLPFVPIRKKGKLPYKTISRSYDLEYGQETIEIHVDACKPGDRCIVVDDLIATGGTMLAACDLLKELQAEIVEVAAIVDLPDLGGSKKLKEQGFSVFSICEFEGD